MDAHVKFRGTRVESPIVPISEVATELTLENGLLQVKPLRFGIGKGKVDLLVTLDGRRKPAAIATAMTVNRVPLGEVLKSVERKLQQQQTSTGTIGGRAEFKGQGNSLKALLASSNGHLGLAMEEGQVGLLLLELIGLDAAESIGILLAGNKPVPLRCAIADFEFIDGIMGSKTFVIDTKDTNIAGEGAVNFKTERIDFRLTPYPKDFSPLSARSPIVVSGPLNDIKIRPEAGPLAARLGLAAVLSAVPDADRGTARLPRCRARQGQRLRRVRRRSARAHRAAETRRPALGRGNARPGDPLDRLRQSRLISTRVLRDRSWLATSPPTRPAASA